MKNYFIKSIQNNEKLILEHFYYYENENILKEDLKNITALYNFKDKFIVFIKMENDFIFFNNLDEINDFIYMID